jgi:type VI secretion system protein ImpC
VPLENADFEFRTLTSFAPPLAKDDTPFCIAVLADFSGRGSIGPSETRPALAGRRRVLVDVDNLEELPGKLDCKLHIRLGGRDSVPFTMGFGELGDFHPDRILERLEVFQTLKKTRELLQDPATFPEAVSQVRSWVAADQETTSSEGEQTQGQESQEESDAETLERLLGKPACQEQANTSGLADMESLIREVVKPYIVPAPDPQQAELLAQVNQAISGQMKAILHHPDFQALEAAWWMLHFLVSHVETDEALRIYAIDVTKAELAADLASADVLQSTGAYRLLVEQSIGVPGPEPYAVLVGAYTFDKTAEDIMLLRQLGRLAQAAGAPFLTAAHSHFAGCASVATTPDPDDWRWRADPSALQPWQELRRSPEAAYLGLVLPRFLLRLPYGKDTDPTEISDFEEFSPLAGHEQYLWGNSAILCACLLAGAFKEFGWALTGGLRCDLVGMPMHIYESDGAKHVTPCAEAILTERAAEVLISKGLLPVLSIRSRDAVHMPRFQSIADPPAPLAGPWR